MIDVLVAGGGPVGLAAALLSARAGLSVAICEPRTGVIDKACGEGLMPGALTALQGLAIDPPGHPLSGISYHAPGRSASANFRRGPGRGVRRTDLHQALLTAIAKEGITILPGGVTRIRQDDHGIHADLVKGARSSFRARYLLAVDGLHSPIRHHLGLDVGPAGVRRYGLRRHFPVIPWSDLVEVHWSPDREAYVTPVGPTSVGVAILTTTRGSFADHLRHFPGLYDQLCPENDLTQDVLGAGPLRQRSRQRVAGRVLLVGDAAGYVDALTGEGIALGIAQARAAIRAVAEDRPGDYELGWRRATWRCWLLTQGLLQVGRRPALRSRLVPAAATFPRVFSAAVNELARPLP